MSVLDVSYRGGKNSGITYHGRNGTGFCTGLRIFTMTVLSNPKIEIVPISSRGLTANCSVGVPVEDIPELIKILKLAYKEIQDAKST